MAAMPATDPEEAEVHTFLAAGSGPLTVEDLERMPDDGRRYELINGTLIVSPAPGTRHQVIGYRLFGVLDAVCPDEFYVLGAPYSVRPTKTTELQPDVLVGNAEDFTDKLLPTAPVLAVEVLSPSTALSDLTYKKAAYERLGVPSYWVIDPDEPSLIVFELDDDGVYQETAKVAGSEPYQATRPYQVRIVPTELLGRLADA
ncbi:MAG: Uma2 family endonuclease [Micromonosporaceae bacterium]